MKRTDLLDASGGKENNIKKKDIVQTMKLQTTSTLNASVLAAVLPSDRHDALFVVVSMSMGW